MPWVHCFSIGLMPWVHCLSIGLMPWVHCLSIGFNATGSLPFIWLNATGSLPLSIAFIALSWVHCLSHRDTPFPTCLTAPQCLSRRPICLYGSPFAFWRPICLLAPTFASLAPNMPLWHPICLWRPIYLLAPTFAFWHPIAKFPMTVSGSQKGPHPERWNLCFGGHISSLSNDTPFFCQLFHWPAQFIECHTPFIFANYPIGWRNLLNATINYSIRPAQFIIECRATANIPFG